MKKDENNKDISIVIPLFNESESLKRLYEEIIEVEAKISLKEVIFVDDGSTDESLKILKILAEKDNRVKIISLSRNYGQTSALGAGVKYATGSIIVPLDADLQNDPEDIPSLISKLDEGYEVVSGWRKKRKDKFLRSLISNLANRIISLVTGVRVHDYGCTLKAYRSEIIHGVDFIGEVHRFMPVYAVWRGARVGEIIVNHRFRTTGTSKYGFSRIPKVLLDLLVAKFFLNYSTKPIYFFGYLGIISFILGFLSFIGATIFRIYGTSFIQTPLLLLTVMLFVVALQLISMGLIADMILRTRKDIQPMYSIKEKIGFN